MKILIVDDERVNRKLMVDLLEDYGQCDCAVNGKDAVEMFATTFKEKEFYDVIFLDIKMPVLDGHDTLIRIRALEEEKGITVGEGVKVVMVSALTDKDTILSSFKEGCEYFVMKPITMSDLYGLMEKMGFDPPPKGS